MIALRLAEIAAACDGEVVGDPSVVVGTVATDSRRVDGDGVLFVALDGEHDDGHRFVDAARAAGAVAALVERRSALGDGPGVVVDSTWSAIGLLGAAVRARVDPDVVAITGSVGKTTTKDLARAAIAGDRPTVAAEGSFNNELGVPLTLLATRPDTRALVVEIGARGHGHVATLAALVRPDVAVVTAVAGAHLEMFGDLDGVAAAKGELVEALTGHGTAVLNAADERVWAMRGRTQARVLGYGYGAGADVVAEDVVVDALGRSRATVRTPWGQGELALPVPGRHNLDNALAAIAAAGAIGVPLATALTGLAAATVSRWRAELHERADGLLVCNDAYNSNPTSALAALALLDQLRRPGGRAVAVLGHMAELGVAQQSGHEEVGVRAGHVADLVVTTGSTFGLGPAARAGGAEVVEVAGPAAAVEALRGRVGPDDVVLVKASRSAGLEEVADRLLRDATPRDDATRPQARSDGGVPLAAVDEETAE